jgi:hypothetical protein
VRDEAIDMLCSPEADRFTGTRPLRLADRAAAISTGAQKARKPMHHAEAAAP